MYNSPNRTEMQIDFIIMFKKLKSTLKTTEPRVITLPK